MSSQRRVLVLNNPRAGAAKPEIVRHTLSSIFEHQGWTLAWHDIVAPIVSDAIKERIRSESQQSTNLIIAAGGDGTVSLIGDAIIQTNLESRLGLGIFPSGTANTLAQELGIPSDWTAAAQFLATREPSLQIDAIQINNRYYFLRVGIGLDAETIRDTKHGAKKRFGRWAYFRSFLQSMRTPPRHRFSCLIDGKKYHFYAVQLFIANGGGLALAPFRLGPGINPADGQVNVCGYDALTRWDYCKLIWGLVHRQYQHQPQMKFWLARQSVVVRTNRPLAVQADGECIGDTPVRIRVVPAALRVIAVP